MAKKRIPFILRLATAFFSLATSFFLLSFSPAAFADDGRKTDLHPGIEWDVGYEITSFHYEEEYAGSKVMEEDGFLHGIRAAMTYHSQSGPLMWRMAGNFSGGDLRYDGQTWDGDPVRADTEDYLIGLRALLGWDCEYDDWASTLFSGLGYRYWNNEIDETGGYEREINWLYLPLGYEALTPLGEQWILGASVEGNLLLYGWVKSHLSDVHPAFNDPTNEQDFASGYGIRGLLFLKRQMRGPYAFSIGVFADYWHVDESDEEVLKVMGVPVATVLEPENETTQVGLRFSVHW